MIAPDLIPLAVPVTDLHELPGNPRRGDVQAVARSLSRFGQRKPIVVREDGTIIAGNHTYKAAVSLGWEKIAVVRVKDDDEEAFAYALADNRTAEIGDYDGVALLDLLRQLDSLEGTGYTPDDVDDLTHLWADAQDLDALADVLGDDDDDDDDDASVTITLRCSPATRDLWRGLWDMLSERDEDRRLVRIIDAAAAHLDGQQR